ncbi:MAG: hypothetical protein ACREQE_05795, partial [Candidatus Binataceae bacterium]
VQEFWLRLKQVPEIELAPFATETLMVTPLGHSVGVINSAIKACERAGIAPSKCLVLCSDETVAKLDEAIGGAEFTGPVKPIRITDPYGGAEVLMQIERQTRTYLLNAREVLVNLTGGTTLMGLAMAAMADKAKRLGRDVRRFGLIDRRTPAEQQADPFKVSEAFWLDEESSDGD